eukprot:jgi/Mesvir1/7354/Mv19161-RA.1
MRVFKKPPVYDIVPHPGPPPLFAAVVTLPDGRRFPESDIPANRCSRKADAEQKAAELAWLELSTPGVNTGDASAAPAEETDPWAELRKEIESFFSDKAFASNSAIRLQHLLARQACRGGLPLCLVANVHTGVKARCLLLDPLCDLHPGRCLDLITRALSTAESGSERPPGGSGCPAPSFTTTTWDANAGDGPLKLRDILGDASNQGQLEFPGAQGQTGGALSCVYLDDAGLLWKRATADSSRPEWDDPDRSKRAKSESAAPTSIEGEQGRAAAQGLGTGPMGEDAPVDSAHPITRLTPSQDGQAGPMGDSAPAGDNAPAGAAAASTMVQDGRVDPRLNELLMVHFTVEERRRRDEERAARERDKAAAAKQEAATPKSAGTMSTPGDLPLDTSTLTTEGSITPKAPSQYGKPIVPGSPLSQTYQMVYIPADWRNPLQVLRLPVCGDGHYVQQIARELGVPVGEVAASRPASASFMKTCRVYFGSSHHGSTGSVARSNQTSAGASSSTHVPNAPSHARRNDATGAVTQASPELASGTPCDCDCEMMADALDGPEDACMNIDGLGHSRDPPGHLSGDPMRGVDINRSVCAESNIRGVCDVSNRSEDGDAHGAGQPGGTGNIGGSAGHDASWGTSMDGHRADASICINWRASDLARCLVQGDAVIACVGPSYLDGVPLVVFMDIGEDDVQALLLARHPLGQYRQSRNGALICQLPSAFRGGDSWQGKMPKALLHDICDQLQFKPPSYTVAQPGAAGIMHPPATASNHVLAPARSCGGYLAEVVLQGHPALHGKGHRHRVVCGRCGALGAATMQEGQVTNKRSKGPAKDAKNAAAVEGAAPEAPIIGRWTSPRAFASKADASHAAALEALWGVLASRFQEPGAAPAVRDETSNIYEEADREEQREHDDCMQGDRTDINDVADMGTCSGRMSLRDARALRARQGLTDASISCTMPSSGSVDRPMPTDGGEQVLNHHKSFRSKGADTAGEDAGGDRLWLDAAEQNEAALMSPVCVVCRHGGGVERFWEDYYNPQGASRDASEPLGVQVVAAFTDARMSEGDSMAGQAGELPGQQGNNALSDTMRAGGPGGEKEDEGDLPPAGTLVRVDYALQGPEGDILDAQRGFTFALGAGGVLRDIDRCVAGMTAGATRHIRLAVPPRYSFTPRLRATCHLTLTGFDLPPEQRVEERVFTPSLARQRIALVLDVLASKGALGSLIDVGCGCGAVLEPLLASGKIPRLIGLDVDATPLRKLARVLHRKLSPGGDLVSVFGGGWAPITPAGGPGTLLPAAAAPEAAGMGAASVACENAGTAAGQQDGNASGGAVCDQRVEDMVPMVDLSRETFASNFYPGRCPDGNVTPDDGGHQDLPPEEVHHDGQPWVEIQTFRAGASLGLNSIPERQSSNQGMSSSRSLMTGDPRSAKTAQHPPISGTPRADQPFARTLAHRPCAPTLAHQAFSPSALVQASLPSVELFCGSLADRDARCRGLDAAILIEVVEHLDPGPLACVGPSVLGYMRPHVVIVSTPNYEYNAAMGMPPADGVSGPPGLRNSDHRFEWTRAEFQGWARGLAAQYGYDVEFAGVGQTQQGDALQLGYSSQFAIFTKC